MKRLIRFCQKENIYPQVYYYTKRFKWSQWDMIETWRSPLNQIILGQTRAALFFSYAFGWIETKEGYEFWSNIDWKWRVYCQMNKIKYFNEKIN